MKKLVIQGTDRGEYQMIAKGRVAGGVVSSWQRVMRYAIENGYDTFLLDRMAAKHLDTEIAERLIPGAAKVHPTAAGPSEQGTGGP